MQPASSSGSNSINDTFAEFFTPRRFALILFILLLASFPNVLIFGQSFVFRDFGLFGYPLASFARGSIWNGELPLWNPYNNSGLPFLAQWNTLVLYPLSWIYFLIPLPWSLSFYCLFHLFIAGMGMYFLLFRWTGNRFAATAGGIAFVFNGFMLNCLAWPNCIACLGWMPWTVLTVEKGWPTGGRNLTIAALVASMQMLGGTPEIILLTWLFLFGLCAVQAWQQRAEAKKFAVRFILIAVVVALLCAAQLLPFLQLLAASQRGGNFQSTDWPMPWFGLANFLVPLFRTSRSSAGVHFPYEQAYTSSYYLGIGTLGLALIAAWRIRDRKVSYLKWVALGCLVFALGDQIFVYKWLQKAIPLFAFMRYPIKFVILITFVVPILMAYAVRGLLDQTLEGVRRKLRTVELVLGVSILAIMWFAYTHPYKEEDFELTLRNGLTRIGFLAATLMALYFIAKVNTGKQKILLGSAFIGLLWLDVLTHVPSQNPVVSGSVYEPGLAVLHELHPQPGLGASRFFIRREAWIEMHQRILTDPFNGYLCYRLGAFDNCNLLDRLPKTDGFYSLYLQHESEVRKRIYQDPDSSSQVLNLLSVSQMSGREKLFDWEANPHFMPMITAGQKPYFIDPTNSLDALFAPDFDPRKMVLLPTEMQSKISATNATEAHITNEHWKNQHVQFDIDAQTPSMAVVSQMFYRPWKAYVDGSPTPLLKANHAFQALEVKAGHHHVELVYEDVLFKIGAVVSATTLLICIVLLWRTRKTTAALPL